MQLSNMLATDLKCEYLLNPLGIDAPHPKLSWILTANAYAKSQSAYRILVSGSKEELAKNQGEVWDSGKVISDQSILKYDGKPLKSGTRYYWKVMVWDEAGNPSAYSETAEWGMGLLERCDWTGKWIGTGQDDIPLFRQTFEVEKPVQYATAFICGMYLHELRVNGEKAGDHVLDPPVTSHWKRVMYVSHDITNHLHIGTNAVGVMLAAWQTKNYKKHDLLLQIEIRYTDGTSQIISTDETWKQSCSPVVYADEYNGETYDARLEQKGWDDADFDDSSWKRAGVTEGPQGVLSAMDVEPRKVTESFLPVKRSEPQKGVYVFDMGQNFAGWVRLKVEGKAGDQVVLRFAELLHTDGMINQRNLRAAIATDTYILKGEGIEEWEPRFTYHGFRYVEVSGYPGIPRLDDVQAQVVHSAFEPSGSFSCSNDLLNQLQQNIYWGHRSLHQSIRLDCPQRDERKGWLGDVAVDSEGAAFNFNASAFYRKWLEDARLVQREDGSLPDIAPDPPFFGHADIVWPSAYIIVLNWFYDMYGDVDVLQRHYSHAKQWVECIRQKHLRTDFTIDFNAFGDWCSPVEDQGVIVKSIEFTSTAYDDFPPTTAGLYSSAYFVNNVAAVRKFADILGENEDREYFEALQKDLSEGFNRRFLNPGNSTYDNGSHVASLLPLAFGLVPREQLKAVAANLVNDIMDVHHGRPRVGLVGMQWLFQTLDRIGYPEAAYSISTQTEYPSLGYMVKNGATTIWELWNGDTAEGEMNSHNHLMMNGDLVSWFYKSIGGIEPDPIAPGFKHTLIRPRPLRDLTYVRADYHSIRGKLACHWKMQEGCFHLAVTVPANCTATVYVPALTERDVSLPLESKVHVHFQRMEEGHAVFAVASGHYHFISNRTYN